MKNALTGLRKNLNMPATLKEAGVDIRQLWYDREKIIDRVLQDPCCDTNPIKVESFMVSKVLEEVAGRG